MELTQSARPLFSAAVRNRGERYYSQGAVRLADFDAQEGWAELLVEGSSGADYEVWVEWEPTPDGFEIASLDVGCTCPHFDDGNYCKHIWAALKEVEFRELMPGGHRGAPARTSSNGFSRPAAATSWRAQLASHARYLDRPERLSEFSAEKLIRVTYLLEVIAGSETPIISLYQQQQKKDGEWGVFKPLQVNREDLEMLNAPEDRDLLALLIGNQVVGSESDEFEYDFFGQRYGRASESTQVRLAPPLYQTTLPKLCKSGRLVWLLSRDQGLEDARPLAWDRGKPWRFRLQVETPNNGKQKRLRGELVRGDEVRALNQAVHCFSTGLVLWPDELARLEPPADFRWLETLRENETLEVPAEDHAALVAELWRGGQAPEIAGDDSLQLPVEFGVPRGRFVVHPASEADRRHNPYYLNASVSFRYGDHHEDTSGSEDEAWLASEGDRVLQRDVTAEVEALRGLSELGIQPIAIQRYGPQPAGNVQFPVRELNPIVAALLEAGWDVEAEGAKIRRSGEMSVSVTSGIDWFDLEGTMDFGGEQATLPELLAAVRRGERYVKLGDGTRGLLPEEWLERYAPLAELAVKEEQGALRFQPGQALLLDSMLAARGAEIELEVDRQFAALRKRLKSFSGVKPAKAPPEFKGKLREYQNEGLGWLKFLEKFRFGGCLADDMGLGKTVQVLALLANRKRRQPKEEDPRPSLVVAPKSLVHNWELEAERFAPGLSVANYTGLDRHERVEDYGDYDVVLTTYGTLRRDIEWLGEQPWDYAILDEAQAIKNAASHSAKASRLLNARHRLALSGTPVENHLGELWSIFEYLNPGMLGKSQSLKRLTRKAASDDDQEYEERIGSLRTGLAPFILRRTKGQVLPDLPEKNEQNLYAELNTKERKQYNELRDHYRASLTRKIENSGLAKSKIHVLEALLRLRQAACHPGLMDKKQAGKPSAKLSLLLDQLTEVIGEGHKALVFSQFTQMLAIVKDRLDKLGIAYEYLDGKTNNRQERIDSFQTDHACPAFLISLKAGGTGLNLTAADYVFLLDPWWNPAVEAQAIDRVHRIGQTKPVFAYRLITRDTVEEKILEMQAQKRDLAKAIISSDSSLLRSLSAEDLQALLS